MPMAFCAGAETRIAATGGTAPAGTERLWNAVTGGVSISTLVMAPGNRSWQTTANNAFSYLERTFTATNSFCLRIYFFFPGALPSTDCNIVRLGATSGASGFLRFRAGTNDLVAAYVATGTPTSSGYPVLPDTLYRLDIVFDATTARTVTFQINGTEIGPFNSSGAITFNSLRFGCGCLTSDTVTGTVNWQHLGYGFLTTDYPFGEGYVSSNVLDRDATHVVSVAGNFKIDNTTDITGSETNLNTQLQSSDLSAPSHRLTANAIAASDYLAFGSTGVVDLDSASLVGRTIRCMTPIVTMRNESGTTANGITVRLVSGSNTDDLVSNVSLASAANLYLCRGYTGELGTGAAQWTAALLNALETRFGFASSVGSIPGLWAVRWMIEFVPTSQVLEPVGDLAAGGWTTETGSPTGLYASVDEDPSVDTDYDKSSVDPRADLMKLQLGNPGIPTTGPWKLTIRHTKQ